MKTITLTWRTMIVITLNIREVDNLDKFKLYILYLITCLKIKCTETEHSADLNDVCILFQ